MPASATKRCAPPVKHVRTRHVLYNKGALHGEVRKEAAGYKRYDACGGMHERRKVFTAAGQDSGMCENAMVHCTGGS